jgi:hypothetical protein
MEDYVFGEINFVELSYFDKMLVHMKGHLQIKNPWWLIKHKKI